MCKYESNFTFFLPTDPHSPQQRDDQASHLPERDGPLSMGHQREPPQVCWGGTLQLLNMFYLFNGTFFYISSWRLNVYMGNDNLNPVHRLLWRSTAPLIKIWLPVWRWLILCCLQWLAVSVCPAHPIVRTALHTAISLFTFDSLHVDFRHCVRALYQS